MGAVASKLTQAALKRLSKKKADHAVDVINQLTHTKGEWARKPFALRPWQENQIIRPLFGALDAEGLRQYRKVFVMLPRKNGKSEIASALALYFLVAAPEIGGEIYSAAASRDQASLVFNVAAQMVRNDPHLSEHCKIIDSQKRIVYMPTGSFYRAIPADAPTAHGFNASVVIYDEIHAAPNRELWDVLTTSMGARKEPLTFAITTAGYDRHSLAYELFDYACKVRDGVIDDPTFLPVLYYAKEDADWTDEKVWFACNPALGDYRNIQEMREFCREAQSLPARENVFRQLYLNQWTEQAVRWVSLSAWDACDRDVDVDRLRGRPCFAGLDLASVQDLTAFVLVFPDDDGGFDVLSFAWCPEDGITDRNHRDRVAYQGWIRNGALEATEGNVTDYDVIRKRINQLGEMYDIREIAIDRWNATQISTQLSGDGFTMTEFGQGFASMSAPTKKLESLILSQKIRHGGSPLLRWCISNAAAETDAAGNIKLSKKKSTEKIDLAVALVMAIGRAMVQPEKTQSVYEGEGVTI